MKIIDLDDFAFGAMIKAPIDEKNVCSDVLLDAIYDEQSYVENSKQSVGFVNNLSTLVTYNDNIMGIYLNSPFTVVDTKVYTEWSEEIIERLTGVIMPSNKQQIFVYDENSNLIYRISRFIGFITIDFKYNQKK